MALWLILSAMGCIYADTYNVEIGQFEKLKINGNLNVIYKNLPDSTGYARYEAGSGNENMFVLSTKGEGSLKVEPSDDKWGRKDLPVLYLYSDFLSSLESYSDQTVEVIGLAPCASLSVNQIGNGTINIDKVRCNNLTAAITTGNGSIYIAGKCINANFRMVGAGLISADQLQAENVKCRILGTGSIGCWPVDNLNVTGLGSTKIYYKGKPNIKKTGGGKLFELPDDFDEDAFAGSNARVESLVPAAQVSEDDGEEDDDEDDDDDEDEEDEDDDDDAPTIVTNDD